MVTVSPDGFDIRIRRPDNGKWIPVDKKTATKVAKLIETISQNDGERLRKACEANTVQETRVITQ